MMDESIYYNPEGMRPIKIKTRMSARIWPIKTLLGWLNKYSAINFTYNLINVTSKTHSWIEIIFTKI